MAKRVIGVVGVAPGMGVTHFTITLANYIVGKWNKKTAVILYDDKNTFEGLYSKLFLEGKSRFEDSSFCLMGVVYFLLQERSQLISILDRGYDYYLIDFGSNFEAVLQELLRCDKKIIIGSLSEWRKHEYEEFLEQVKEMEVAGNWDYLAKFGLKEDKKEFKRKEKVLIRTYPYIENPFQLKNEHFMFLEQFI